MKMCHVTGRKKLAYSVCKKQQNATYLSKQGDNKKRFVFSMNIFHVVQYILWLDFTQVHKNERNKLNNLISYFLIILFHTSDTTECLGILSFGKSNITCLLSHNNPNTYSNHPCQDVIELNSIATLLGGEMEMESMKNCILLSVFQMLLVSWSRLHIVSLNNSVILLQCNPWIRKEPIKWMICKRDAY